MPYRAYVLTSSDSGYAGQREDVSGPTAMEMLREAGYEIAGYALLPDEFSVLTEKLIAVCDSGEAELLITTGGTGFSARDCMPEATLAAAAESEGNVSIDENVVEESVLTEAVEETAAEESAVNEQE